MLLDRYALSASKIPYSSVICSLLLWLTMGCNLDEFDKVDQISSLRHNIVSDSTGKVEMTLILSNRSASKKQLTFNTNLGESLELNIFWYCNDELVSTESGYTEETRQNRRGEPYRVVLEAGREHQVALKGSWKISQDILKLSFDGYDKVFSFPMAKCNQQLKGRITGIWLPGKPGLAYAYEDFIEPQELVFRKGN